MSVAGWMVVAAEPVLGAPDLTMRNTLYVVVALAVVLVLCVPARRNRRSPSRTLDATEAKPNAYGDWKQFVARAVGVLILAGVVVAVIHFAYGRAVDRYEARPRLEVAANVDAPAEALRVLAEDSSVDVRREVAMNPSTPDDVLRVLAGDTDIDIRLGVAAGVSTPDDALRVLAVDIDDKVRAAVATNPATGVDLLETLALDAVMLVRVCVGANLSTPTETLTMLAGDSDASVRTAVVSNPAVPAEALLEASSHTASGS